MVDALECSLVEVAARHERLAPCDDCLEQRPLRSERLVSRARKFTHACTVAPAATSAYAHVTAMAQPMAARKRGVAYQMLSMAAAAE